jgi:transcriptional regulator GlxA family with amidase domain
MLKLNRRNLLKSSVAIGVASVIPSQAFGQGETCTVPSESGQTKAEAATDRLLPPTKGRIPVAFVVSEGAVVIDFAGPWAVFNEVMLPGTQEMPFYTYMVAETLEPITASGGMKLVPDFTFQTAPTPKVVVIPAQSGATAAKTEAYRRAPVEQQASIAAEATAPLLEWIRKVSKTTDVTMSVCTGAFILAKTGLLSGKSATTFHDAFLEFQMQYPDIHLKRGARFVEEGNLATSGGLSSGIDLSIRVVERYFGREIAEKTAYTLEYQGKGWTDPNSNQIYANMPSRVSTVEHPLCPVCGMDGNLTITSEYKGKKYFFCMQGHKDDFNAAPATFVKG